MKKYILLLISLLFLPGVIFGQLTEEKKKALYIPIFAKYVVWPNEDQLDDFTIGILGDELMVKEVRNEVQNKLIKGKKAKVVSFSRVRDIKDVDILWVDNRRNDDLLRIDDQIKGKKILLITDRSERKDIIDINMLSLEGKKKYEVNKRNILAKKMVIQPQLLLHGGTETDLKDIYRQSEESLKEVEAEVAKAREEIKKQQREILRQTKMIDEQNAEIDKQKEEIAVQQEQIELQTEQLMSLNDSVLEAQANLEAQMRVLDRQKKQMTEQEKKLKENQEEMEKTEEELAEGIDRLEKLNEQIEEKEEQLQEAGTTMEKQETAIWIIGAILIAIVFLAVYIYRSYKQKQALTLKLEEQNVAINMQKEEILAQAEQLELTNLELEKLSIVARETDNAVVILDERGDFEWVNESYTKIFGYTLEQLVGEISVNIIGPNTPVETQETIRGCINDRKTVTYQFPAQTRTGKQIWIQATLTPILDKSGNISKIIAVDSDITKIKEAEEEIRKQSVEIAKQRDNYLEQKNIVEKAYQDIQVLSEFGQKLTSTLDIESINNMIYDYVKSLIDISAFGIGIYNSERERIEFRGFMEEGKRLPFFHTKMSQDNSFSVWCIKNQQPVYINDFKAEYMNYITTMPYTRTSEIPESAIYLPLVVENKPIGVVTAQSYKKNAYTENDLTMLQTLASYISIAFDNANAYKIINMKNQHISGSIRYAKTIQQAILPIKENMEKLFRTFTIFRPKDVVSGDFYWFSRVPAQNGDKEQILVATIDCTGHGVPGAFMSMIGNRLMNEIVNERRITKPNEILKYLDEGVKKALKQDQTDNNDGMDVCLVNIRKNGKNKLDLSFAGAKRPLFYKTNGSNEIKILRGTRRSIGGARSKRNKEVFINQDIELEKGDLIYLTSDGLMDQNAPDRKRFGTEKFIQLLEECSSLPLAEQKRNIEFALDSYQQNEEQRDDVTILGIQLS
jgi:PAS domain S-box-containing protein